MALISINPATEEVLAETPELTNSEIDKKIVAANEAYGAWKKVPVKDRSHLMRQFAQLLIDRKEEIGKQLSIEMGKTITGAIAELEKCAWGANFYATEGEKFLEHEIIKTTASESYVRFDPIGIVFAVMPWNFPFWQVIRFAAPALMAGNVALLKHASNVQQSAQLLEELFIEAGFPKSVFSNLSIGSKAVEQVIRHDLVHAVTLTGSEFAGKSVAKIAGEEIKKSVLELGGSDPFIVLADADIENAVKFGTIARLQNNGQSCICAKRFIIVEDVYAEFVEKSKIAYEEQIIGDPLDLKTTLGPVVSLQSVEELERQVSESLKMGAKLITGGKRKPGKGFFYLPTILADVTERMPAFTEEIFGPVSAMIKAKDANAAIKLANDSRLGLGSSIWTKDLGLAKHLAGEIESGSVFINEIVKSDPRLPFGGIKKSGYGRELSHYGLREFVNIKTVYIK